MRFLFVNLQWQGAVSKKTFKLHHAFPPLDLILMSNFARSAGHHTDIYDGFVAAGDIPTDKISAADWIVVATTPHHMWQCPNSDWDWIKTRVKRFPLEKVILTGVHASVFPEKSLQETGALGAICQEPEAAFVDFLDKGRWQDTAGTSYLDVQEGLIRNPQAAALPMEQLVVNDYIVDMALYRYPLIGDRTGVFEASRGCPWKCTFCNQEMFAWNYRAKDPEIFAEEVKRVSQASAMKSAYFFDLEFTLQKARSLQMCQELINRDIHNNLKWCCQTRADMVPDEVLEAMKDAGCRLIHFGVESATPSILKATNKKISIEKIEDGVRRAKKYGLKTACFFMFGLPDETPEDFDTTLEFARSLNPTYASFHFAIPFPGTPLYERYLSERGLQPGVWPSMYFDQWPPEKKTEYLQKAFRKFYVTPKRWEIREFLNRLDNIKDGLKMYFSVAH